MDTIEWDRFFTSMPEASGSLRILSEVVRKLDCTNLTDIVEHMDTIEWYRFFTSLTEASSSASIPLHSRSAPL